MRTRFIVFFYVLSSVICSLNGQVQSTTSDSKGVSATVQKYVALNASNSTLRLIHVRVIDGTGAPPSDDQMVEISNGKITAVRATKSDDVADGKITLDLSGHTVIPGLVGMHDHLFYVARPDLDAEHAQRIPTLLPQMTYSAPRLYLASGVTTLRTTGSLDPYTDLNLKEAIESNQEPGPHMDVTGPYLQGKGNPFLQMHTLKGPEDARETVNYWASQGATSFKAYTLLTRAELKAAIDAAHARGLKITGHLCSITYPEAAELGIDNLEHGFFVNTQMIPNKQPDVCPAADGYPAVRVMDPNSPEAKALIKLLVDKHVAVTSTQTVYEKYSLQQRALDVLTPQAREAYLYLRNLSGTSGRKPPPPGEDSDFRRDQRMEWSFVQAGGLLLAGPDPTGDGHIIPGFGDQRELELLVDSGFSPVEAIKIGTLNGAVYLGRDKYIGSIAVGKNADLVVVKGDPSAHISDIENVEIVFRDGLGFDSAKLLDSVKGRYGLY
jgi:imidazolonepropionase-like amidohydrolase